MSRKSNVAIIGAGLAGCEAAWQLASRNIPVTLFEMRPKLTTPAHQTGNLAELVCSNSFKSVDTSNAHGLLKAEMECANSLIIESAKKNSVPAGSALAVDRALFSAEIKYKLSALESCEVILREITDINVLLKDYSYVIVAAGPLMSDALSESLKLLLDDEELYFYDAIAPVVYADSINMDIAFKASRYDKGEADYINCPMNREQYEELVNNLVSAKKVPFKDFEQAKHFEGCLPVEVLAKRGIDALAFGAMKPVGLNNPKTGEQHHAVLQLRQENQDASLYNLVGCQTRMTWPEQKRVFRMIPGLENCEFARLGSMHRNTYVNAPNQLNTNLSLKVNNKVFLAGQITGVEGYTESSSMGLWAALNVYQSLQGNQYLEVNPETMIGGLVNYLQTASPKRFQPMNANFGLLQALPGKKIKNKKEKRKLQAELALSTWKSQLRQLGIPLPEIVFG
ncbi:MAG: methylenetetrahydrofolate--tRNA-(uracil(54)-C(5))-methyltransferase (FADH(2)-oxidizing) TrmFO [Proteobacteria bacterium]|nr:methylenetetrahydrofolate--tRNA-(uracil(54)-C(5))-methyltransferase (FADH(2)-oxidizing) TrmFO [Pseudomonadota bacterium]